LPVFGFGKPIEGRVAVDFKFAAPVRRGLRGFLPRGAAFLGEKAAFSEGPFAGPFEVGGPGAAIRLGQGGEALGGEETQGPRLVGAEGGSEEEGAKESVHDQRKCGGNPISP
jgi:hypothetical protein